MLIILATSILNPAIIHFNLRSHCIIHHNCPFYLIIRPILITLDSILAVFGGLYIDVDCIDRHIMSDVDIVRNITIAYYLSLFVLYSFLLN